MRIRLTSYPAALLALGYLGCGEAPVETGEPVVTDANIPAVVIS